MEKKQFFESFISDASSDKGHVIDSFSAIKDVLNTISLSVSEEEIRAQIIPLFNEVLLRAWMFDEIFNGDWKGPKQEGMTNPPLWPLVVMYLFGEPFFINRSYCSASGLSPSEIRSFVLDGKLYEEIYSENDAQRAKDGVKKLRAGKGYKNLELSMKHIHRTTFWNSYGWVGDQMEIRIGRDTNNEDIRDEYYIGNTMNSMAVLQNLYTLVAKTESVSPKMWNQLFWIGEYLSLFDFFWNHGGFATECLFLSKHDPLSEISGNYNTMYAKIFEQSFQRRENFQKVFSSVYGDKYRAGNIVGMLENVDSSWIGFCKKNKKPAVRAFWRHFSCPHDIFPERPIFGVATIKPLDMEECGFFGKILKKIPLVG